MNYLSHYYFDQTHPDPYFLLGVALPDLVKNHRRSWNLHPHKHQHQWQHSPELQGIAQGWNKHLRVDQLFHDDPFFIEQSGIITKTIRSLELEDTAVRASMIGHIGLEIMLDALLIQHQHVEVKAFYDHLQSCEHEHILAFLGFNQIQEATSFLPFYERFCEVKYLHNYTEVGSLSYALNRIQYRITGRYFTDSDNLKLNDAFSELFTNLSERYFHIFEKITDSLKNA